MNNNIIITFLEKIINMIFLVKLFFFEYLKKDSFKKVLSPSLFIFKSEFLAVFSIFNRIFGIFLLIIFLFMPFFFNFFFFIKTYTFLIYLLLFFIFFFFFYHLIFGKLKILLYLHNIFILINSNINKINNIYIIYFIMNIMLIFFSIYLSINLYDISVLYYSIKFLWINCWTDLILNQIFLLNGIMNEVFDILNTIPFFFNILDILDIFYNKIYFYNMFNITCYGILFNNWNLFFINYFNYIFLYFNYFFFEYLDSSFFYNFFYANFNEKLLNEALQNWEKILSIYYNNNKLFFWPLECFYEYNFCIEIAHNIFLIYGFEVDKSSIFDFFFFIAIHKYLIWFIFSSFLYDLETIFQFTLWFPNNNIALEHLIENKSKYLLYFDLFSIKYFNAINTYINDFQIILSIPFKFMKEFYFGNHSLVLSNKQVFSLLFSTFRGILDNTFLNILNFIFFLFLFLFIYFKIKLLLLLKYLVNFIYIKFYFFYNYKFYSFILKYFWLFFYAELWGLEDNFDINPNPDNIDINYYYYITNILVVFFNVKYNNLPHVLKSINNIKFFY